MTRQFSLVPEQGKRALVMGVLNLTPDSFSDGGRYLAADKALQHAISLGEEGADIIDIGAESTRPGAKSISAQEELDRLLPVLEAIRQESAVPISIDTSKPQVMRAAVETGADMINDVYALQAPDALATAADLRVPVCLMHMQGRPRTMQQAPSYGDVVAEVRDFLAGRVAAAEAAGIERERLVIDPGFGFGKTLAHNLQLLVALDRLSDLGLPVLAGLSRKSMLGALLDRDVESRLPGSLALALLAAQQGAAIIRVHDVAPTVDALRVLAAVNDAKDQAEHG